MARIKSPTRNQQSKASLRSLAATKPTPQNFGVGKAVRKGAAALNKKARKARKMLSRSIKQEPSEHEVKTKLRRASDSPPLVGWVEDRAGAITNRIGADSTHGMDGSLQPSNAKKGPKGDVSKRKLAMKAAKRQARAKKKAANVQQAVRERAKGAKRRIEQLKRDEERLQRQQEAHTEATEANVSRTPQPSDMDADGVLNVLEPLLRTIYRIQGIIMSSSRDSSFAAASPFPLFIRQKLRKARLIVKMYQERRQGTLSPMEGWALECAQRAVEELEYMERSDEEEGRRRS